MKKITRICILIILGVISMPYAQAQSAETSNTATIYLIRQTGYSGSGTALRVFIDSALLCKLHSAKYLSTELATGKHTLSAQFYGSKPTKSGIPTTFVAEAGKEYYFVITQSAHLAYTEVFINETTVDIGKQKVQERREDPKCR